MSITGTQLRAGDTIAVWWRPHYDTITRLEPYRGAFTGQPGWNGARIAYFAIMACGMTVFPGERFERTSHETPT